MTRRNFSPSGKRPVAIARESRAFIHKMAAEVFPPERLALRQPCDPGRDGLGARQDLAAGAIAAAVASLLVNWVRPDDSTGTLAMLLDLSVSLWVTFWTATYVTLRLASVMPAVSGWFRGDRPRHEASRTVGAPASPCRAWAFAIAISLLCTAEWILHGGAANPFLATSRPEAGMESWTNADGYATILDGYPAQGDGLFLLNLLGLFMGDRPAISGEFDRRAGHVYLVSLLQAPLGAYWAFATVNLGAWITSALAVWRLGWRRWPDRAVGEVAAVMVATGQGFIFMSTAPQAHPTALAAFAVVLVLLDEVAVWTARGTTGMRAALAAAWATGLAGLLYFGHIPLLLVTWVFGAGRVSPGILAGVTVAALAIATAWQWYGEWLLGLRFSGGNNDLAGGAIQIWFRILSEGLWSFRWQFHAGSVRGLLVGSFYYPWWILAGVGLMVTAYRARVWALAVFVGAIAPAIAFSPQFRLPRVAYFAYPAVYLLAAAGLVAIARAMVPPAPDPVAEGSRRIARGAIIVVGLAGLAILTNLDLVGNQSFTVWFHQAQENAW